MGIGEFGLRTALNGSVQPYVLNTTSLEGTLDANATGIQPLYVLDSSPDAYSIQLNAVLANVTLFGNSSFEFWTQSVALYYAQSHLLYLVSNVWNFSSFLLTPNSIVAHGANGTLVGDSFYVSETKFLGVTYPFNLTLFLNSTVTSGNDSVDFSAVVASPSGTLHEPYDFVEFNSSVGGSHVSGAAGFSANGFNYDPVGHANDFELVLGGPGGGSQVDLFQSQATMDLRYWNASVSAYQVVPSALSYGADSGESASGVNVEWESGVTGPFAILSTGPSILAGLWNASGPPGVVTIQTAPQPSDTFVFLRPAAALFTTSEMVWAPTVKNASVRVAPGTYEASALMSDYDPINQSFSNLLAGTVQSFSPTLTSNPSLGVTTPIWVWNNGQFPAISSSGNGTPGSPYLIDDTQVGPMSAWFGTMNDYTFPVFPGVFFVGTSASAELNAPGPFATQIPQSGTAFPGTNDLAYTFYNVTNVSVVGGKNISGWYSYDLAAGAPFFATANMVFWNSSRNLVALNTFNTQSEGIYLYGGTQNTIWNNTIQWDSTPQMGTVALLPPSSSVGIQDGENGDLIYDNAVYTATTASTPKYDVYTGQHRTFNDTWNVTNSSVSLTRFAAGFPGVPLYGSIVNTSYQGGNFWWDYGSPSNPLKRLPYNETGSITHGGDYVPLVPTFAVTFLATGHPGNSTWGANLTAVGRNTVHLSTTTNQLVFPCLPGDYIYLVDPPNATYSTPPSGSFTLSGSRTVLLSFHPENGTLVLSLLPFTASVTVDGAALNGSSVGQYVLNLTPGEHTVVASAPTYEPNTSRLQIQSGVSSYLNITLLPFPGTLHGTVTPSWAVVMINGSSIAVGSTGVFSENLTPGMYPVASSAPGYVTNSTTVTIVANQTTTLTVSLRAASAASKGLSALDLELLGFIAAAAILVLVIALILWQRRTPPPTPPEGPASARPPPAAPAIPPGAARGPP